MVSQGKKNGGKPPISAGHEKRELAEEPLACGRPWDAPLEVAGCRLSVWDPVTSLCPRVLRAMFGDVLPPSRGSSPAPLALQAGPAAGTRAAGGLYLEEEEERW